MGTYFKIDTTNWYTIANITQKPQYFRRLYYNQKMFNKLIIINIKFIIYIKKILIFLFFLKHKYN
jgi:hypothetical protein